MIYIDKEKKESIYLQIYEQIRDDIMGGVLQEGEILPGSRGLAKTLSVSRNTVSNAYDQLLAEGYISARPGIGYMIIGLPKLDDEFCPKKDKENISQYKDTGSILQKKSSIVYDLTNSSHTSDLFPKKLWKRYTLESLEQLDKESKISAYLDKQGESYLRDTLLSYLQRIRGVHCTKEQIIITAGIQQSLDIVCKLMPKDRPCIYMEEPGYNKAHAVFSNNDLEVKTIPVDTSGLKVCDLPQNESACAIYTTPSHQFPTGVTLPVNRRLELLKWASNNQSYILEDDFDSELRYYARPIPSLQSIDTKGKVIYLGTFSKALSPSIRMGYMILPQGLLDTYQKTFLNYNSTVPLLNQYVIARLIETGEYDRHVRRLNNVFKKRMAEFLAGFSEINESIKISGNGTGQYFLLEFPAKAEQEILIRQAASCGVKVYSTMEFWQDKAACPPNTLFLGFSKIDLKDIPDCIYRLKKAWAEWI